MQSQNKSPNAVLQHRNIEINQQPGLSVFSGFSLRPLCFSVPSVFNATARHAITKQIAERRPSAPEH